VTVTPVTVSSPRYLPIILAVLTVASLAAACCLDIWAHADASEAWTAFIAFSAALLGIHIPPPAAS
jgi:hypothetical protein